MPHKWEIHAGLRRSPIIATLPLPLIFVALLLCLTASGIVTEDSAQGTPSVNVVAASGPAPPEVHENEKLAGQAMEKSPAEMAGLRQEVTDLGTQVQQQTMSSVVANDEVQTLRLQLASAQKKILAADADRDTAVDQASELRQELDRNARHLAAVCDALLSARGIPAQHRQAMAVLSACPIPAKL